MVSDSKPHMQNSTTEISLFLNLSNELLLRIFYQLPTTSDALSLARTCSQLHELFKYGKNKITILRFAANVPRRFDSSFECALSDCVQNPPSMWWLEDEEGYRITLTIDYSQFSEEDMLNFEFRDMASIRNSTSKSESQDPLMEFLEQFDNFEHRCRCFEPLTITIIKKAAQFQKDILSDMPVILSDLSTNDTVIALLLNCFVITHDIFTLLCYCGIYAPAENDVYHVILPRAHRDEYDNLIPLLEVDRRRPTSKLPKCQTNSAWDLSRTVESTLQYAAQLLLKTMIRQDPRDLPKSLYALCIICVIRGNVEFDATFISWKGPSNRADTLISDLCRLQYICSYGGQPLTYCFDREAYVNLVGQNQIAIQHCYLLNKLWVEGAELGTHEDEEKHKGLNGFYNKVDDFVYDY